MSTPSGSPSPRDSPPGSIASQPNTPPTLPKLGSSEEMMNITPYSSNPDDYVIYLDSDIGSQNSLPLRKFASNSSASELDSSNVKRPGRKVAKSAKQTSLRRDSIDSSPSPRRKLRRRSRDSDRLSKLYLRPDGHIGSGYTTTPSTGKIFRNLLILEESLREQLIQLRAMRRKYLTFLLVLCCLIASISHHLYFGVDTAQGAVRVLLQFVLLGLIMTLLLYHLSGEYQKTIVLPRKFLSQANKGLRQLNVRLVKIKTPLTDVMIDLIREICLLLVTMCRNSLHRVYPSKRGNRNSRLEVFLVTCQLRCQPRIGVTDVKLVLNARVFNTDVREGWELYRSEFWINEGMRRRKAMLSFTEYNDDGMTRSKLLEKDKQERKDRRKSIVVHEDAKLSETDKDETPEVVEK